MKVAATTCISTLKLNFSPVRGSILGSVASWPYQAVATTISKLKLNFSPVEICMPLIYGQSTLYMYDGASVNGRKKIYFFFSTVFPKKNSTVFQKQKNFFFEYFVASFCAN